MSKELTPAYNYEQELNENLYVLELEERLEMVQGGANEESLSADIVISCCLD